MKRISLLVALLVALACAAGIVLYQFLVPSTADVGSLSPSAQYRTRESPDLAADVDAANIDGNTVAGRVAVQSPSVALQDDPPSLTIHAVTADGGTLSGCRLLLRATHSIRGERPYAQPMLEVSDAIHVACELPQGTYDVMCSVPSLKDPVARVSWNGAQSRIITVGIAARQDLLGGIVRSAAGEGVARALVLDIGHSSQAYFCVTDDQGRFMFCRKKGHAEPSATFNVSSKQGAAIADSQRPSELFWGTLDCVIGAQDREKLLIRLTNQTGRAIEDFTAYTETNGDGECVTRTAVATHGLAQVRAVPTGRTRVLVIPSLEWVPVWGAADIAPDGSGVANLKTDAAVILEGRVVSSAGVLGGPEVVANLEAIGDATAVRGPAAEEVPLSFVGASRASAIGVRAVAVDGRFGFGCDPRVQYRLRVTAPGYSPFHCIATASNGVFPPVEAVMAPTQVVRATVTPPGVRAWLDRYVAQQGAGADGKTCCFALVEANPVPGGVRGQVIAKPDMQGNLEFGNLSSGTWRLWFRGPFLPVLIGVLEVGTAQSADLPPIDLAHLRPGYIKGTVACASEAGRPTAVAVCSQGSQVRVPIALDGSFDIAVPSGEYNARITVMRTTDAVDITCTTPIRVSAGNTTALHIPLVLQALPVMVVNNENGKPMAGATLSIDEDRAFGTCKVWTADEFGLLTIDPCPLGEFGLSMLDPKENWIHVERVAFGGATPVVIRVQH